MRSRTSDLAVRASSFSVSTPNGCEASGERAGALEHIGEGVPAALDRQASCACPAARRRRDSAAPPRCRRPGRACPRNRRRSRARAVPSSSTTSGISIGRNVLIARRRHLERGGQVGPELEAVHAALRRRPAAFPDAGCRCRRSSTARRPAPSLPRLPRLSPCSTVPAST